MCMSRHCMLCMSLPERPEYNVHLCAFWLSPSAGARLREHVA